MVKRIRCPTAIPLSFLRSTVETHSGGQPIDKFVEDGGNQLI